MSERHAEPQRSDAGDSPVLELAHEMAVLAAMEAGQAEDIADAALTVVLTHLFDPNATHGWVFGEIEGLLAELAHNKEGSADFS